MVGPGAPELRGVQKVMRLTRPGRVSSWGMEYQMKSEVDTGVCGTNYLSG